MEQEQKTNRPTRRRTRVPQGTGTEQPYVEQFSDILLVRNKDDPKTGIRAVSGTDEKGNIQTVPADEKHENSFLKFDKRSSILEKLLETLKADYDALVLKIQNDLDESLDALYAENEPSGGGGEGAGHKPHGGLPHTLQSKPQKQYPSYYKNC